MKLLCALDLGRESVDDTDGGHINADDGHRTYAWGYLIVVLEPIFQWRYKDGGNAQSSREKWLKEDPDSDQQAHTCFVSPPF